MLSQWLKRLWGLFGMARPMQLVAVTLVFSLGTLIAIAHEYRLQVSALVAGYFALIPISMSIHYANEYADYQTDALTIRTPFSGGSGALARIGLSRELAWVGAWATLFIGMALGIIWAIQGILPWSALIVLGMGAFGGWMYSLPPLRLAWRGWGELDNALLGGVVLPLYGYTVQSGRISLDIVMICLPFGIIVFTNLLATTWADREADAKVGKYTLATQWTTHRLRRLYLLSSVVWLVTILAVGYWSLPYLVWGASLGIIPLLGWGWWSYTRIHSPFPTVATMVILLIVQVITWGYWGVLR